jgi:non-heme chloroperoxidase
MTTRRSFLSMTSASTAAALASTAVDLRAEADGQAPSARPSDGMELFRKDWGSGPTVILCHGWPVNADSWDYHACVLAEAGYRVIAPDRRGFGRSKQPSAGYDYDTFADDLARVIESSGARDVTLIGFSMGGGEVLRYMARHGGKRVSKVAFVAAAVPYLQKTSDNPGGVDSQVFADIKAGLRQDRAQFMTGLFRDVYYDLAAANSHPVSQEVLDWSFQMAMQAGLRGTLACVDTFGTTDLRGDLAAVRVPALFVHGTADKPVPIALARGAAAQVKRATLIEYQGASHGLLVTERDRVSKDLLAFLRR